MDKNTPLIQLERISFSYTPERPVLRGASLSLMKGEKAALLGPNGSGKTTLFHLIMGLLRPLSGTIRVFGSERVAARDFHEVRRRVGLLFQDSDDQLFSPTVAEDIAFGPFNLGKNRDEVLRIVHQTLSLIGLEGFEDRVTHKLSGGEKRLVALGTVLAMQPEVLLLDEPVIGLDDEHRSRFTKILRDSSLTFLIISHDHDFLGEVAAGKFRMADGAVVRDR